MLLLLVTLMLALAMALLSWKWCLMSHIHKMKKLSAYFTADVPQTVYVPSLQESIQTSSQCAVAILEWVSFKYFVITTCIISIICPMMASLVSHTVLIVKRVLASRYELPNKARICKNFLYIAGSDPIHTSELWAH